MFTPGETALMEAELLGCAVLMALLIHSPPHVARSGLGPAPCQLWASPSVGSVGGAGAVVLSSAGGWQGGGEELFVLSAQGQPFVSKTTVPFPEGIVAIRWDTRNSL